jgi:hypothetical protein
MVAQVVETGRQLPKAARLVKVLLAVFLLVVRQALVVAVVLVRLEGTHY